jgi:hypothetical protein
MADSGSGTATNKAESASADGKAGPDKTRHKKQPRFTPREPFFFELSRLMVVAIKAGNGQLVYKAQTKPNGRWETNWTPIETVHSFGAMAAGLTGDGRVAVVAQPSTGAGILFIDEAPDAIDVQRWNRPVDLGNPVAGSVFGQLTMAYDVDGRVEVFGTDAGGNIWWKYQNPNRIVQKTIERTPPGTHEKITVTVDEIAPPLTPWGDWVQLPGGLSQIIARRLADGRIILFGINRTGDLYRNEQKIARALKAADWSGWVQMDDGPNGTTGVFSAMAPNLDKAGAMNLFALNTRGQILHARQSPPCCPSWASWTTTGFIREGVQAVAAGMDGNDDLVVAALDRTKVHQANYQLDVEAQQWSGWLPFGTAGDPSALALDYNADGRLTYFSHLLPQPPAHGGLWCVSQMAFDSTEWELAWTELAPNDIRHYVVVRDLTPPRVSS